MKNVLQVFYDDYSPFPAARDRRRSFLELPHVNLVEFLDVKSMKVLGSPKTVASSNFSLSCQATLSFQKFIKLPFKCFCKFFPSTFLQVRRSRCNCIQVQLTSQILDGNLFAINYFMDLKKALIFAMFSFFSLFI